MDSESVRRSRRPDRNSLSEKQPGCDIARLLSGRPDPFSSPSFSQEPWNSIISILVYGIITSLKLSLLFFPIFTLIILISYSAHYSVPITEVAATASDVILHLFVVVIFFIFSILIFVLLPFFVLGSFNQAVRNAYLPDRPQPGKYLRNIVTLVGGPTLSFGGLLLIFSHIILLWLLREDPMLPKWVYVCTLLLYGTLFILIAWTLIESCKRAQQRRKKAIKISEKRKFRFYFKKHKYFKFVDSFISLLWISAAYLIWLRAATTDSDNVVVFSLFSPLLIAVVYNVISKALRNIWHVSGFSLAVILAVIGIWPGAAELSRIAFHRLGIGGEIPVQVALLPANQLGLLEEVIKQNEVSGSIYRETIGPFRLILYGKERMYLSTMTSQECLPENADAALDNTLCERVFSIRTEYIASIDTTRSIRVRMDNSR